MCFDDSCHRPGEKFSDADLIGIPTRVVVSPKTLEQNKFEYKLRQSNDIELLTREELLAKLTWSKLKMRDTEADKGGQTDEKAVPDYQRG